MTLGKPSVSDRGFPAKPEFRIVNPNNLSTDGSFVQFVAAASGNGQETGRERREAKAASPRAANGPLR